IRSYSGHTASDVSVELEDPHVVWCGDLVWNGMVPNYVDAIPTRLGASVHALLERGAPVYVPGHGGTADAAGLQPYVSLLDDVEAAARRAIRSEEHTSELQSREELVCRLLLEKIKAIAMYIN